MRAAAGASFVDCGTQVYVDYVAGGARIDGAVAGTVAVEIESRPPKQVCGAVLDLLCHPFRKKLLVLIPAHVPPPQTSVQGHLLPMNCVSWTDAHEYCCWAGKRLLSQREWAWAGHGGDRNSTYPWGNDPPTADVPWHRGDGPQGTWLGTCPVGGVEQRRDTAGRPRHGRERR